ncbi:MAG: hypothetical protein AAF479_05900 [Pseudomonadota bacterium]
MRMVGTIALLAGISFYPQLSWANGFTGSKFGELEPAQQRIFMQDAMMMAVVVLTQTRPQVARCVNDWYFKGEKRSERNAEIRSYISKHETVHPAGVVMAVIVKVCGPMDSD